MRSEDQKLQQVLIRVAVIKAFLVEEQKKNLDYSRLAVDTNILSRVSFTRVLFSMFQYGLDDYFACCYSTTWRSL